MPRMRAVQVAQPDTPFELVEREIPQPGVGEMRIKVQACGICHSDSHKRGHWPIDRITGHDGVQRIDRRPIHE